MTGFSAAETEPARALAELSAAAGRLLRADVLEAAPLSGGGNNLVAEVRTAEGRFAAKGYFRDANDRRDRLGAEFSMLSFLWSRGVRTIPRPVAADATANVAVYEFVEGTRAPSGSLEARDVASLAELLGQMWTLRTDPEAAGLPDASDACFAPADYVRVVERRLARLSAALDAGDAEHAEVLAHLRDEVAPCLAAQRTRLAARADFEAPLPTERRTLSPSDVGFHNALRTGSGWVFLDFEYAGWDDPAKMLCDACRQAGAPLDERLQRSFLEAVLERFGAPDALADRVELVFPLVGLNWSLIVLNEFLPVGARRRRFARGAEGSAADRAAQLEKSRRQLERVRAGGRARDGLGG